MKKYLLKFVIILGIFILISACSSQINTLDNISNATSNNKLNPNRFKQLNGQGSLVDAIFMVDTETNIIYFSFGKGWCALLNYDGTPCKKE